ncbi:hypothetical protein GUJ93_ZPchr0009g447 [Zizania palustris]|uniref:Uncharacterized protein n=1 Tax=Zizania palustris TaxID=103762 RepID=A0A8J5V495_ZIZPA|nr:hypothetical protein GUJ93_ZPchr0009g447 [Zizania palustris]
MEEVRAAAVCAVDSLASSREMNKKLAKTLKYAISQMQDICKKLQETVSFCYTDEDHADGYRSEDSAVWADVSLDEELDTMSKAQTLGEHCVMQWCIRMYLVVWFAAPLHPYEGPSRGGPGGGHSDEEKPRGAAAEGTGPRGGRRRRRAEGMVARGMRREEAERAGA